MRKLVKLKEKNVCVLCTRFERTVFKALTPSSEAGQMFSGMLLLLICSGYLVFIQCFTKAKENYDFFHNVEDDDPNEELLE